MKWVLALVVSMPIVYSCDKNSDNRNNIKAGLTIKGSDLTGYNMTAAKGEHFLSVTASGDWKISVSSEESDASWVTVKPESGNGSKSNVILSWSANVAEQERTAVLTLKTSGSSATLTLTQAGKSETPEPTPGPNPNPNPNPGPSEIKAGWLELPAMPEDSEFGFFSHDMKIGNVKTRNYTYAWDYENLVAPWVAYPLSTWTIGSGKRTDAWGLDPSLPEKYQPVLYRGFGGGYDRGHQLPSADRLNYAANVTTFYGTNMTPQRSELNQHSWANLESKVRSWASRADTCYVVTGCITKGSTKTARDNEGKKVTVPTHYYKAVLRYSKNSTFGHSGYIACAILLEHKGYGDNNNFKPYAMSIDELEKKIGIDLFANLPAAIGEDAAAKVEAEDPATVSWWW